MTNRAPVDVFGMLPGTPDEKKAKARAIVRSGGKPLRIWVRPPKPCTLLDCTCQGRGGDHYVVQALNADLTAHGDVESALLVAMGLAQALGVITKPDDVFKHIRGFNELVKRSDRDRLTTIDMADIVCHPVVQPVALTDKERERVRAWADANPDGLKHIDPSRPAREVVEAYLELPPGLGAHGWTSNGALMIMPVDVKRHDPTPLRD